MSGRKTHKKNRAGSEPQGIVRIIGGQWRSRKIPFPEISGLRPTPDRVRETLFNWLQPEISGARVLDLFAGSGCLGFEALSRGAVRLDSVDQSALACNYLQKTKSLLNTDLAEVHCVDAQTYLNQESETSYNIVFVDPPFALNMQADILTLLIDKHWLAAEARIYVESPVESEIPIPSGMQVYRQLQAGNVLATLLRYP